MERTMAKNRTHASRIDIKGKTRDSMIDLLNQQPENTNAILHITC